MRLTAAERAKLSRRARRARAGWWFEQMRQIVDRAVTPTPAPRPTQPPLIWNNMPQVN